MADYSQKWHDRTSTRSKSSNTSDGLAAIQAQLNNLGKEIKKVNERVYAAQVDYELCNGPHYNKDCPLKEEAKTLKEAYYTQFQVPFPQAGREVFKELRKLQVHSTKSTPSLKRLLKENSMIEEEIKATMKVHCFVIIKDALPPKEKDPGSFTLPCSINNMCFDKALAELGASVSVMPYSAFTNLGLGKLAPTKLIIELVDKTVKRPNGIAKNMKWIQLKRDKSEQNMIKTGQKREAWRSPKKSRAVSVDRARKTE
nr:hypothetical protein [Tanacetum cinerariifolium]